MMMTTEECQPEEMQAFATQLHLHTNLGENRVPHVSRLRRGRFTFTLSSRYSVTPILCHPDTLSSRYSVIPILCHPERSRGTLCLFGAE
jgi:hypothetical protein